MAKVLGNRALISGLKGAIGGLVYHTDTDGSITVQRLGERTHEKSEEQLAYDSRFLAATAYANKIKADPALAPLYQLVCTKRMTPYQAGLRDFLKPPVVEAIDLGGFTGKPGGVIRVVAWDDFQVIQLTVMIRHAEDILEEGTAEWGPLQRKWVYTAQGEIPSGTSVLIEATATDRPGNQGVARVLHLVS